MKRRDIWVILSVVVLGLSLLALSRVIRPAPADSQRKALSASLLTGSAAASADLEEADSYLRIKQGRDYYELIPLNGPGEIIIRQDGGWENVIHIDYNSVKMHSANCPNLDCVRQGEVTLENMSYRVFQQWVTCLPHQLSLELITREQALQMQGETP